MLTSSEYVPIDSSNIASVTTPSSTNSSEKSSVKCSNYNDELKTDLYFGDEGDIQEDVLPPPQITNTTSTASVRNTEVRVTKHKSNFGIFCRIFRNSTKLKFPNLTGNSLTTKLGEIWRTFTQSEKEMYTNFDSTDATAVDEAVNLFSEYTVTRNSYSDNDDGDEPRNNICWNDDLRLPVLVIENTVNNDPKYLRVMLIDCTAKENNSIILHRNTLRVFDEIDHLPMCTDIDTYNFVSAMYEFAEWDAYSRHSYFWPEFVINLVQDAETWKLWRENVKGLTYLSNKFPTTSKLYLFYLCAMHIGVDNELNFLNRPNNNINSNTNGDDMELSSTIVNVKRESDEDSIIDDVGGYGDGDNNNENSSGSNSSSSNNNTESESDSEDIKYMKLKQINDNITPSSAIELLVLNLIYAVQKMKSTEDKEFARTSSRVGNDYQVDIPPIETRQKDYFVPNSPENLVYSASDCSNKCVDVNSLINQCYQTIHLFPSTGTILQTMKVNANFDLSSTYKGIYERDNRWRSIRITDNQRSVVCTMLGSSFSSCNENMTSSSKSGNTTATTSHLESMLLVTDGTQRWTIPYSRYRSLYLSEDMFLRSFYINNYNVNESILSISQLCKSMTTWTNDEFSVFFIAHSIYDDNIEGIYNYVRANTPKPTLTTTSRDVSSSHANSGQLHHLKGNMDTKSGKTMKDIIYLYYLCFPLKEFDDQQIDNDYISLTPRNDRQNKLNNTNNNNEKGVTKSMKHYTNKKGEHMDIPNRWPRSLNMSRNNLYWIKNSNTPGICLDIIPCNTSSNAAAKHVTSNTAHIENQSSLTIFPISCNTPYHKVVLPASSLVPFDEIYGSSSFTSNDERSIDFTLALRDFCAWELESYPKCKWYVYPSFIIRLISHPTEWSLWRKNVERNARGRNESRREIFFGALKEYQLEKSMSDNRCMEAEYPWNDEPLVIHDEYVDHSSKKANMVDHTKKNTTTSNTNIIPDKKRKSMEAAIKTSSTIKLNLSDDENDNYATVKSMKVSKKQNGEITPRAVAPVSQPIIIKPKNKTNLFWSKLHSLPCIFYGNEGDWKLDKFRVHPICCVTYHYDTEVTVGAIEELTESNLKFCADERTGDFASALLMFYEWDIANEMDDNFVPEDNNVVDDDEPYQWPDFILDIIAHRELFSSWRKKVERKTNCTKREQRKLAYFDTLKNDYLALLESFEKNSKENGSAKKASPGIRSEAHTRSTAQTNISSMPDLGGVDDDSDDQWYIYPSPSCTTTNVKDKEDSSSEMLYDSDEYNTAKSSVVYLSENDEKVPHDVTAATSVSSSNKPKIMIDLVDDETSMKTYFGEDGI